MASINLPFPGFYESIYSGEVDHVEEMEVENFLEREREERAPELRLDADQYGEVLRDATDYSKAYEAIARDYVEAFDRVVGEELGIPLGLKFEEMTSPRFYNFETDRLFATISDEVVAALFDLSAKDKHATLGEVIRERFTSRSGFSSFYSNDLAEWLEKPLDEWDHNELGTLLLAACKVKGVEDIHMAVFYEMANGEDFYHAWEGAVDWAKFDVEIAELRDDRLAELKADDPDYAPPPERCPYTLDLFEQR